MQQLSLAPPPSVSLAPADTVLDEHVLAAFEFGPGPSRPDLDARRLRVGLAPLDGSGLLELWRVPGTVRHGREGALAWSSDGQHLFFALEVPEAAHAGLEATAHAAYEQLGRFVAGTGTPHLLRLWNYFDAINEGEGDAERYRLFCRGRAEGMRAGGLTGYPAATAIGRQDGVRVLQVYGLAAAHPGTAVENPRQVSAWQYPRQYGPTPPLFARGMRAGDQLLVSGTAAVVGHASAHEGELAAQLEETLANLRSLLDRAAPAGTRLGAGSLLKAYVREPGDAAAVGRMLHEALPDLDGLLVLAGDICRQELLVELDGTQRLAG